MEERLRYLVDQFENIDSQVELLNSLSACQTGDDGKCHYPVVKIGFSDSLSESLDIDLNKYPELFQKWVDFCSSYAVINQRKLDKVRNDLKEALGV